MNNPIIARLNANKGRTNFGSVVGLAFKPTVLPVTKFVKIPFLLTAFKTRMLNATI